MQICETVRALLTAHPYKLLKLREKLPEMLANLTGTAATPLVLWTTGMRQQLESALEPQLAPQGPPSEALQALVGWQYSELKEELVVEDVYVRLYCEVCFAAICILCLAFRDSLTRVKEGLRFDSRSQHQSCSLILNGPFQRPYRHYRNCSRSS